MKTYDFKKKFNHLIGIVSNETRNAFFGEDVKLLDRNKKFANANARQAVSSFWCEVNTLSDFSVDDEEYINAKEFLVNVEEFYTEALRNAKSYLYHDNMEIGSITENYARHIRFAGNDFIERAIFYHLCKFYDDMFSSYDWLSLTEEDRQSVANQIVEFFKKKFN